MIWRLQFLKMQKKERSFMFPKKSTTLNSRRHCKKEVYPVWNTILKIPPITLNICWRIMYILQLCLLKVSTNQCWTLRFTHLDICYLYTWKNRTMLTFNTCMTDNILQNAEDWVFCFIKYCWSTYAYVWLEAQAVVILQEQNAPTFVSLLLVAKQ